MDRALTRRDIRAIDTALASLRQTIIEEAAHMRGDEGYSDIVVIRADLTVSKKLNEVDRYVKAFGARITLGSRKPGAE